MGNNSLDPTIQQFRDFINQHPKLRKEIRRTGRSWQEYYEKWMLLGEKDAFWDDYKEDEDSFHSEDKEKNKSDFLNQLMKYAENMDIDKVQKQVHQLSGTISTIQELIDQYQGAKKGSRHEESNPFGWFRD
ncbi:YlbD family protein [Paucisalibacillus sp. EB02]|uniref:YlbD family protein n=1 Tax=Paucisalibacillus sp. EB02 TaxID=1347087 RepID=UPI0004BCB630|nr:spore coat protein YlbD [Paucisalibacillus sp. EB02]